MKYLVLLGFFINVVVIADQEIEKRNETIQIFTAMPKVNFTVNPDAAPLHSTRGHHKGLVKSYQDCFGMTPEFHGKDKHCIFPFIYRGIVYETCTYVADSQPWCATATDVNGHMVTNDWGYCTAECPVMPHTHCRTVQGGPIEGAFCRFPFRYKDVEYNMCTRVDHYLTPDAVEAGVNSTQGWCATKVDAHGDYVPHHWGICQRECRPPKTEKMMTLEMPTTPGDNSVATTGATTITVTTASISNTSSEESTTSTPVTISERIVTPTLQSSPKESTTSTSTTSTTSTSSASSSDRSIATSSLPPQHIPADQLPVKSDRATYIPKVYSDPIGVILQENGIELDGVKQEL